MMLNELGGDNTITNQTKRMLELALEEKSTCRGCVTVLW